MKTSKSISRKQRVGYSEAENNFREFIKKEHPELHITKRGLPDFMIIKNNKVVGFVEVKMEYPDNLKTEQELFKTFCKENNIPYQVWRPLMGKERWIKKISVLPENSYEKYRRMLTWGGEIWDKI